MVRQELRCAASSVDFLKLNDCHLDAVLTSADLHRDLAADQAKADREEACPGDAVAAAADPEAAGDCSQLEVAAVEGAPKHLEESEASSALLLQ